MNTENVPFLFKNIRYRNTIMKIKSRDNILLSVYVILTLYLIASIVEVYLLHYLFMVFIILSSFVESGGFQKNAKEDK